MPLKLAGKIALITGGTTGIGLAIAKRFVNEGAHVIVTGRRQAELDAAVSSIGNAVGIQADSANMAELDALFDRMKSDTGYIDVLVANAGGGSFLPLGSITEEQYDDIFNRNVKGVLFTVQKALPLLSKGASVILMGSVAGSTGAEAFSVYAASKAAVRAFTRNWILDLKGRGIRVNTLSPGPIMTPGLVGLVGSDPAPQQRLLDRLAAKNPMGRIGDPDEVAKTAVFLASDESSFVNGIEMCVDGGVGQI